MASYSLPGIWAWVDGDGFFNRITILRYHIFSRFKVVLWELLSWQFTNNLRERTDNGLIISIDWWLKQYIYLRGADMWSELSFGPNRTFGRSLHHSGRHIGLHTVVFSVRHTVVVTELSFSQNCRSQSCPSHRYQIVINL